MTEYALYLTTAILLAASILATSFLFGDSSEDRHRAELEQGYHYVVSSGQQKQLSAKEF